MDAAWALTPLTLDACAADERCVVLPGALTPVVMPVSGLEAAVKGAVAAGRVTMDLDLRVGWLLDAGRTEEAWNRCAAEPRSLAAKGQLMMRLATWSAARQAEFGLTASNGPVTVFGADPGGRIVAAGRGAHEDVVALLPSLGWPRWAGQVIICTGSEDLPGLEGGRELVIRPSAPLIRLRQVPADNNALRGLIAGRLASLALGLASPPAQGWPPWLRLGVPRVAALIGSGQGASPKEMLQRRQEAGGPALSAMLQERVVGGVHAELAEAVVAPLLSQRRREHWGSFLDLLRLGKPAQAALAEAYGLDLERLLNDR